MDTSFNESNDHKELIDELMFDEQNKAPAENQAMVGLTTPVKNQSKQRNDQIEELDDIEYMEDIGRDNSPLMRYDEISRPIDWPSQ